MTKIPLELDTTLRRNGPMVAIVTGELSITAAATAASPGFIRAEADCKFWD